MVLVNDMRLQAEYTETYWSLAAAETDVLIM
jgi:hypothetical protein